MLLLYILSISLIFGMSGTADYLDFDEEEERDYYEDYYEDMPEINDNESGNRVRRFEAIPPVIKVLSPEEIREVRGILNQLLAGKELEKSENPFPAYSKTENTIYRNPEAYKARTTDTDIEISTLTVLSNKINVTKIKQDLIRNDFIPSTYPTKTNNLFEYKLTKEDHFISTTMNVAPTRTSSKPKRAKQKIDPFVDVENKINLRTPVETNVTTRLIETTTTIDTTTIVPTETKPTRSRELDMPRLLSIIADLASEFETNLTRQLNETLFNMSIPTCTTPTTEPPTTSDYDANYTGVTVAKCFVCGLDIPGIPRHAHCADAFAGDFLPLVPVDPTAKGKISTFRKYCKYSNVHGYTLNETHPRAIYGRWTGGCAVRWIDLSGIYTQRTCRNRLQPSLGKHFASKRMAKLERSLWNIENGCIVSPMATLVPLSRGISLYARFHACVCTGSWCNIAIVNQPWILCHLIMLLVVIVRKKTSV